MCGEVGWLPPRCESRVGAAHRRRGTPCQDASGLWCFSDADDGFDLNDNNMDGVTVGG